MDEITHVDGVPVAIDDAPTDVIIVSRTRSREHAPTVPIPYETLDEISEKWRASLAVAL